MRAEFSDPQGPFRARAVPFAPAALLVLATVGAIAMGAASWWVLLVSAALVFSGATFWPTRQRRRVSADVELGPGYLAVKQAGARSQRILAKDIEGATTARTSAGFLLTLAHKKRSEPLTLLVPTEAEADELRRALGIGHGGFGSIGWRSVPTQEAKSSNVGRIVVLACALLVAGLGFVSAEAAMLAAITTGQFWFVGAIVSLLGWVKKPGLPNVLMAADALRIWTTRGWFTLPYDQLLDVKVEKDRIVFLVPPPYHQIAIDRTRPWTNDGLSDEDAAAMVSQIKTAAARARGYGPLKNDVTGRVEVLRRQGESPRDWLVRLDMAGQMLASGSGYRGQTLDMEDLWAILEDPEADAELRAAAARVLRHSTQPDARVRIDAAVAAVRDESTTKKLRIAIRDDLDGASYELASLDAQERPRMQVGSQGVRW